jgi:hypothetical protein
MNWLIPVLGIATVAGSLMARTTLLDLERKRQAEEAFTATLDRLQMDQQLGAALKTIHDGEVGAAAERLDLLLCDNILRIDSELGSADPRTRAFVQDVFQRLALLRPKTADGAAAGSTPACTEVRAAAQRILELALARDHSAPTK